MVRQTHEADVQQSDMSTQDADEAPGTGGAHGSGHDHVELPTAGQEVGISWATRATLHLVRQTHEADVPQSDLPT